MKIYYLLAIIALFLSCSEKNTNPKPIEENQMQREIHMPAFQTLIDSSLLSGSILIYDLKEDSYYSNSFDWAKKGQLPASTFKITNSMIALETEVIENDSTLIEWDGESRRFSSWNQDLIFRNAFHFSCVPCYQEVARKIGTKRMNQYLSKLNFGKMQVDSSNLDMFWLEGESRINQFEQIDFLKRFHQSKLPISNRTEKIMKRMIILEENEEYKLSGKTGWSISNGNSNAWFVGYLESNTKVYFFATNIEPKEQFDMSVFPRIRKEITIAALKEMELISR